MLCASDIRKLCTHYTQPSTTHLRWSFVHFPVVHLMVYELLSSLQARTWSPCFPECFHLTSFLLGLGTLWSSQNLTMVWHSWLCWNIKAFFVSPGFFLDGCIFLNGILLSWCFATVFLGTDKCLAITELDTSFLLICCMPWLFSKTWSIPSRFCITPKSLDFFVSAKNCRTFETKALLRPLRETLWLVGDCWHGWNRIKLSRNSSNAA